MNRLERELRESLKQSDPPEGFAQKVIARAYETEDSRSGRKGYFTYFSWQKLAAAAVIVMMVGGAFVYQRERRLRAENERTKEQLIVGLQITSSKLRRVHERLEAIQHRTVDRHFEQ